MYCIVSLLKARKGAYDGRGNQPVKSADEAEGAFAALSAGGKVKRAVVAEYASVQEHVRQVAG